MATTFRIYTRIEADLNGEPVEIGSLTTAQTLTVTGDVAYERDFDVATATVVRLLNVGASEDDNIADFDLLVIISDKDAEIQLVTNEGGTVAGDAMEAGFVVALKANIPFVLASDDSRNFGNPTGFGTGAGEYGAEIDTWESNWNADVIDRIEYRQTSGGNAKVRVRAYS
jgi:hypothetical protein